MKPVGTGALRPGTLGDVVDVMLPVGPRVVLVRFEVGTFEDNPEHGFLPDVRT